MKLPEFIEKALSNNTTSLGTHPAFPPDEECSFVASIIRNQYANVMQDIDTTDPKEMSTRLSQLVSECMSQEEASKEALEKLCIDIIATIFQIPDDTVIINSHLVNECDMSKYRMVPEPTTDFTFDDIEDMSNLSDEIYKRRMIDALIAGCAISYATKLDYYIAQVYGINPRLPQLYGEIIKYNNALLFNHKDTIKGMEKSNSGKVDVYIGQEDERIRVEAEGVIFPVLLEYTIKGILEIAALQGLPEDRKRAEYIMSKTDYRLAENWDMRLGVPLWNIIMENVEQCQADMGEIGPNFIIMELSKLSPDVFNGYLQNAFKKTSKGLEMTQELCDTISYNKGVDDFDNYVQAKNSKYAINDNEEYTADELLEEVNRDKELLDNIDVIASWCWNGATAISFKHNDMLERYIDGGRGFAGNFPTKIDIDFQERGTLKLCAGVIKLKSPALIMCADNNKEWRDRDRRPAGIALVVQGLIGTVSKDECIEMFNIVYRNMIMKTSWNYSQCPGVTQQDINNLVRYILHRNKKILAERSKS